jgi:uncharacterized protein
MEYSIIGSANFHAQNWSGGTSTELFISPATANYLQRNFRFRLSSATVAVDRSEFTPLSGVSRKLMVLDGETKLFHKGHHTKQLRKFDVDEFEGEWETSSFGKCTDFNLMCTEKTKGELRALVVAKDKDFNYNAPETCDWVFVYLYTGELSLYFNKVENKMRKGDLLVVSKLGKAEIKIHACENSELIFSELTYL